jgi:hypothetical protein
MAIIHGLACLKEQDSCIAFLKAVHESFFYRYINSRWTNKKGESIG